MDCGCTSLIVFLAALVVLAAIGQAGEWLIRTLGIGKGWTLFLTGIGTIALFYSALGCYIKAEEKKEGNPLESGGWLELLAYLLGLGCLGMLVLFLSMLVFAK